MSVWTLPKERSLRHLVFNPFDELSREELSVAGVGLSERPGHRCSGEHGRQREVVRAINLQPDTCHRRGTSMQYLVRALAPWVIERGARCLLIVGSGQRALNEFFPPVQGCCNPRNMRAASSLLALLPMFLLRRFSCLPPAFLLSCPRPFGRESAKLLV